MNPWDDDVDICISKEGAEKLVEEIQKHKVKNYLIYLLGGSIFVALQIFFKSDPLESL